MAETGERSFINLSGKTGESLTISNAGAADNAPYRCRINTIYYDQGAAQNYYISAYSDAFSTAYAKRASIGNLTAEEVIIGTLRGLKADLELYSANTGHKTAPSGNVTFTIKGTDYAYSKTVALDQQSSQKYFEDVKEHKLYSTASFTLPSLPDGVYTVGAYYSGSRVFKDNEITKKVLVVVGNGTAYQMKLSSQETGDATTKFTYGEKIWPFLTSIGKNLDGEIIDPPVEGATYKLFASGSDTEMLYTPGDPTPNVGSYTLKGYNGSDEPVFSQDFTVAKKSITIAVENRSEVYAGTVSSNPPVITCNELSAEALGALKLSYTATNTAGNVTTLSNETDPGNYRVIACTGSLTPYALYDNYSVTYVSGTYTIVGSTHWLTAVAAPYTSDGAERPVGTVGISNQISNHVKYTAGSTVVLYATPQAGYEVDTWTATFEDGSIQPPLSESNIFTLLTQAQDVTVKVTFKPALIRLTTIADPSKGGTITCSDDYFSSGAYVGYGAEYAFIATPKEGYHFSTWKIVAGGITTTNKGTANQDGSNELTVTVGAASTTVYAVFERDAYTLSLSGDITASYLFDDDGVSSTPPVKRIIASGAALPGDTEITVTPKTGYGAKEGALFNVNGQPTAQSASLVFPITSNTTVALETVRNNYPVTVTASNGTITARVNGTVVTTEQLASVAGGSALSFTARADRGYVFDHWKVNDADVSGSNSTLTIAELGEAKAIEAVFTANTPYTATAAVSNPARGSMSYTLRDIYGEQVGQSNTPMPAEGVTVYKGESITFTAQTVAGSMMEQWKVNSNNYYTTQKTYTIDEVSDNISVTAYLKAATSYAVYFDVAEGTGTLVGRIDGQSITSGDLQFGGSDLRFTATPDATQMLKYWTITAGNTAATENTAAVDENGTLIVDPTYIINPLKQNLTVRAYFTTLVKNNVTLSADESKGVSKIVYITPVEPTDDGKRNITSESVRSGGTVKLSFTPASGYATSVSELEQLVEKAVNPDASVTVIETNGSYTMTVTNLKTALDLSTADIFYRVHEVTMGAMENGTVSATPAVAKAGETVSLTVTPSSGYKLASLTLDPASIVLSPTVSAETLQYTFTIPDSEVTVGASFEKIPVTPPVNGGSVGGGGAPEPQTIPAGGNGNTLSVNVTVSNNTARLDTDQTTLQTLSAYSGTVSFDFTSLKEVSSASIPANTFGVLTDAEKISGLSIALPDAGLTFDQAALTAIGAAGSGDVTLSATMLDTKTLTEDQKALVGDRPVLDLTLAVGNKQVSDFGTGTVQVNVPYALKPGENPEAVVVWYLNDKNILEAITGQYDVATGSVHFQTDHFSKYVIGQLPFQDVRREAWYFDSVSFAFANGLFSGTSNTGFAPEASMTRSMLVTVLWRMEGEPTAKKTSEFSDVKSGQWYENAVAWAAENGIVSGYGNGYFGSNDPITREQMAVILMGYAKLKGYDVSATADLKKFSDSTSISSWATTAMQWANSGGLISGAGASTLNPQGEATRAQVAAILMRYIETIAQETK